MANEPFENENDIEIDDDEDSSASRPDRSADRQSRGYQQRRRPTGSYRRGYSARRKVCAFCVEKVKVIDWKEPDRLRRYVNDGGSMRSRRKTGTCAKHQRRLAVAIKRARHMALLPYTTEHVRIIGKG